jgi:dTDP-4-amino-4,6-dideoxygalactose transaminase
MTHLKTVGISTGIHYPIPLHLQKAYIHLNYIPEDFPTTEKVASQIISLPMFPQLTSEQQERVGTEVSRFVEREALFKSTSVESAELEVVEPLA